MKGNAISRQCVLALTVAACMLAAGLVACAPATASSVKGSEDGTTAMAVKGAPDRSLPEGATLDDLNAALTERAEEYAPEERTLADGARVQLTPDVDHGFFIYPNMPTAYNTYYLNADNRGCASCHTEGLADLVQNKMLLWHYELDNGYGTDVTPMQCQLCHDVGTGYVATNFQFGNLIHGIHSKDTFDGNCMSCHAATSDGNGMMLWEEAKNDAMQGIAKIDADTLQADFTWEQDTMGNGMISSSWMSTDTQQSMIAAQKSGAELDPEVFDNWEFTVNGEVENPYTMKLPDLIAEAPSETLVVTQECGMNPSGGDQITQVEITGIPISWLIEKAGVKDTAKAVMATAPDGWSRGATMEMLAERDGYLVYEIDGERLDWDKGYPVRVIYPGRSAQNHIRWVSELNVVADDDIKLFKGWALNEKNTVDSGANSDHLKWDADDIGTLWNKPNAGIFHLHEGEILKAGEPHEFEGYANGFDSQVAAVEISMDNGATWTRYDTSASDLTKWVYWHFTFTPEEPGAYTISVRGVLADGTVGYNPDTVMFNAE